MDLVSGATDTFRRVKGRDRLESLSVGRRDLKGKGSVLRLVSCKVIKDVSVDGGLLLVSFNEELLLASLSFTSYFRPIKDQCLLT
jgi:hypothetical protein